MSIAIQINGKTRDVLKLNKDTSEEEVNKMIFPSSKASNI